MLIAVGIILFVGIGISLCWIYRGKKLTGDSPSSPLVLIAILFTSGLDGGFILLPLLEFPIYDQQQAYAFANPLAIELGFWGITAWYLYFVSTIYFLTIEPKLQLFKHTAIKVLSSLVVITTCAFTLSLFIQLVPEYLKLIGIKHNDGALFFALTLMIIFSLFVSIKVKFMTRLSQASVVLFVLLILVIGLQNNFTFIDLLKNINHSQAYFTQLHHFVLPFNDYHEFYLAWWLTWTIMLGQFVAKFVNQMTPIKLLLAMVFVPLVPTAIWFYTLYHQYSNQLSSTHITTVLMVILAMMFVINSLDFMVANYSKVLKIDRKRLGLKYFLFVNTLLLLILTALFKEQLLLIEWTSYIIVAICIFGIFKIINKTKLKQLHLNIYNFVKIGINKRQNGISN